MKLLNPKLVLDPAWICKAYTLDLEYYQYLLLGAQQVYLRNLELGKFDNFYEIAFHYFNLNSVISGGKLYGPGLKVISDDSNLSMISAQLADKEDTPGKSQVWKRFISISTITGYTSSLEYTLYLRQLNPMNMK
jgi:hypothetical protein